MDTLSNRKLAAKLARQLYSLEISINELKTQYPRNTQDAEINRLIDLIEHEPKVGGLFGASKAKHRAYLDTIFEFIKKLEK